jgi:hypothetical protein
MNSRVVFEDVTSGKTTANVSFGDPGRSDVHLSIPIESVLHSGPYMMKLAGMVIVRHHAHLPFPLLRHIEMHYLALVADYDIGLSFHEVVGVGDAETTARF